MTSPFSTYLLLNGQTAPVADGASHRAMGVWLTAAREGFLAERLER